jgi:hypothetical protein
MTFFKKHSILFRCNYCNAEVSLSKKFVLQLEADNRDDSICPLIVECHYCHMGFVIPVNYKSKTGKIYNFDELANKIPHLNSNTLLDRLLDEDNL